MVPTVPRGGTGGRILINDRVLLDVLSCSNSGREKRLLLCKGCLLRLSSS